MVCLQVFFVNHPLTNEKIPLWLGDYVLMDYGEGAVMGVPAHDQRDFEFATKYKINIKQVIKTELSELLSKKLTHLLLHQVLQMMLLVNLLALYLHTIHQVILHN